jgi:hypothetical protein
MNRSIAISTPDAQLSTENVIIDRIPETTVSIQSPHLMFYKDLLAKSAL